MIITIKCSVEAVRLME